LDYLDPEERGSKLLLLDRLKVKAQTKGDTLVLQVGGWA